MAIPASERLCLTGSRVVWCTFIVCTLPPPPPPLRAFAATSGDGSASALDPNLFKRGADGAIALDTAPIEAARAAWEERHGVAGGACDVEWMHEASGGGERETNCL